MATRNPVRRRATKVVVESSSSEDAIQFDAERIIAGITYHLVDSGIALEVDPGSVKSICNRLRESGAGAGIARDVWAKMEDPERLQWLLFQAGVTIEQHDGVVKLTR